MHSLLLYPLMLWTLTDFSASLWPSQDAPASYTCLVFSFCLDTIWSRQGALNYFHCPGEDTEAQRNEGTETHTAMGRERTRTQGSGLPIQCSNSGSRCPHPPQAELQRLRRSPEGV